MDFELTQNKMLNNGKYQILEIIIGKRAFASVYLALDNNNKKYFIY